MSYQRLEAFGFLVPRRLRVDRKPTHCRSPAAAAHLINEALSSGGAAADECNCLLGGHFDHHGLLSWFAMTLKPLHIGQVLLTTRCTLVLDQVIPRKHIDRLIGESRL